VEEIPQREVAMASFDGGSLLGSYRAYEAMKEWATFNGYALSLPAFEIYHKDGRIEYQLPIQRVRR
jgi:effector-binding domain-containing protein